MISSPSSARRHPATPAAVAPTSGPNLNPAVAVHAAHRLQGRRLEAVLRETGRRQLQQVGVIVDGRAVTLEGRVDTYVLKQIAQESIRPHLRGMTLRNHLVVASE
ncbi:hypothetical protein [Novipirellula sp.]|uniref:hypothetical protein n=1 Tax=Novipirellula sp. TaxID=2795430 RepID=UPI0035646EA6